MPSGSNQIGRTWHRSGTVAVVDADGNVVEVAEAVVQPESTESEAPAGECTCPAPADGATEEAEPEE